MIDPDETVDAAEMVDLEETTDPYATIGPVEMDDVQETIEPHQTDGAEDAEASSEGDKNLETLDPFDTWEDE